MKTYWTNFGMKGLLLGSLLWAQSVGIGTSSPDASARLDVSATDRGVLIPRVSLASVTDATTIPNPATSLLVYNTNAALPWGVGYYYNAGTPAAPRWVSLNVGEVTLWYHRSGTGSVTSNNTNWQILPGLSQTITVPTGFVADVEIWAQASISIASGSSNTDWAVVDVAVFRNGSSLTLGGYNRGKLNNRDGDITDIYPLVIIARDANVPAGTYTYDVRGRRNNGSYQVTISANCASEVNCGELKLAVRYQRL
jgi:hypothetical protein